jgi:hypothetical protein
MSDAKPRGGKIVHDVEAQSIATIGKVMAALPDDAARARVLAWANGLYGAKAADGPAKPGGQ